MENTDINKDILSGFANNEPLISAVRKILEEQFNASKLELNLSNEQLGERARARIDGMRRVEEAFRQIARYKTFKPKKEGVNPAR